MRILIFSHEFPPVVGGAGFVAYQNALELYRLGYKVDVLTKNYVADNGYPFNLIQKKIRDKLWFISYSNACEFDDYDVILLNDASACYTAGMFFKVKTLRKCICFLHGSEPKMIFDSPSMTAKLAGLKFFYNRTIKECFKVISPSYFLQNKFLASCSIAGIKLKINIHYAGVDDLVFYPDDSIDYRTRLSIGKKTTILLTVSRVIEEKGYLDKLSVFKRLCKESSDDYHWIIVGDGSFLKEFKCLVLSCGLEEKITFLGSVKREALRFIYSSCDIFFLLSSEDEAFGLVYIEAQMCGLPAIAYNRAGPREAIMNDKTGFLVEDTMQCFDLLMKKKQKKIIKQEVISFAKKYSAKNRVNQLLPYLRECCSLD